MKVNPFSPELRTMAFVSRWAILQANVRDNVASHSFYVTLYARIIADIIGWKGPIDYMLWQALIHDADETITGDVIGPAKKYVLDEDKAYEFISSQMEEKMPGILDLSEKISIQATDTVHDEAIAIVNAADKLDALLFLVGEARRGNNVVRYCIEKGLASTEGAWRSLPAPEDVLSATWQTVVKPSINAHYTEGGRGI